jgi:two-component system, OmpR family, phosphate regulon sensor histidine kinase PhoR
MANTAHILIYSAPELADALDLTAFDAEGYEVTPISQPKELELWLIADMNNSALIIAHPSASQCLLYASEIRHAHLQLPIILVTEEIDQTFLKQALELGCSDYLTPPLGKTDLMNAVQRSLERQKSIYVEQQFERVLLGIADGFILADLHSNLVLVNHAARKIFAIKEDPLEGRPVNEIFYHPDFLDIFKPQRTYPYRSEIPLDNGHVYSAQASLIPEVGIAVVLQDITHLKELDRVKTDFVNTISHDIRSPLTSIYGFIGLIDRVGPINRQQSEFIHHIQSSVQHITALINDLLDLNRVESGYDLQMSDVHLTDILTQTISDLEYQISEKMQEVVLTVPDDLPVIVGNSLHLQRMVSNLVENAVKFTPPMGRINVRCRVEAGQTILEVSDNGPGIPFADQPHIFEKFYRGSNLSQVTDGTGLGLSIVNSIVEKHHGRIWLESSPLGTTFTVILPM